MKNRWAVVPVLSAMIIFSTACSRTKESPSSKPSKITVHTWGSEFLAGPRIDSDGKLLMFLPLISEGGNSQTGGLLQSWEHSSDCLNWTYHLRRDVRWHDGVPVTAQDIKFSLELFYHPDVLYQVDFPHPESIHILDDYTLSMTFRKPQWALEGWTVFYPKHLLENLDPKKFYEWDFWKEPVGNGPYRYVRHVPKTMIEFEANPDFYKGKPKINRVILKFGGNPLTELLSGNVDLLDNIKPVDIPKIKRDKDIRLYAFPIYAWLDVILWNHKHPLFNDPVIRRALTMAINRQELIRSLYSPDDVRVFDVLSSVRMLQQGELPAPLPYDPEQAKGLLKKAGWQDEDGDGILERDGNEFRFKALVRSFDVGVKMHSAVYIQEQLRRIGIKMDIQRVVEKIHEINDLWAAAIYSFWNNIATPEHSSGILTFFGAGKSESPIGYKNPRVATLLEEIQKKVSPEEQDLIFRRLMPIFSEDIPMTILYPHYFFCAANNKIRGLDFQGKKGTFVSPLRIMGSLWIE